MIAVHTLNRDTNGPSPFGRGWEPACSCPARPACRHCHHRRHIHPPEREKILFYLNWG